MRLLFVSYWGLNEGLTAATVLPHLQILAGIETIEQIVFCSIERGSEANTPSPKLHQKIVHIPLVSQPRGNVFLTKANDFIAFPKQLVRICSEYRIDKMICRSPMAGALGFLASRKNNIPFVVESFEPHAESMIESGVWTKLDPRYWIELFFENQQIKAAGKIFPVSYHHKRRLMEEGLSESKIIVIPCCVALDKFKFDAGKRSMIRQQLGITESQTVGIYVGKYGGIYYDEEAFDLYRKAFDFFGTSFRLIILTEQDRGEVIKKCLARGIEANFVFVQRAKHEEVNAYLSAADFAFSTIKPVPSRLYCSPIKNGEYWANGLPILTEMNIGDDSDIIAEEGGGVIVDIHQPDAAFQKLKVLIAHGRAKNSEEIQRLAQKHRSMQVVESIYRQEFSIPSQLTNV
ncbi:MAG: glycosyltransferase [Cyclobacteriaceae bacterium]|jgi:glycosyltransferase involved in cell wall biosynthesis|nr:glycosyltransferase [Flammeovirgaceae bacterium]